MYQLIQPFYRRYLILYKINVCQLSQVRDVFDMLDAVEAQVQAREVGQLVEALNVADEVIVQVEFFQIGAEVFGEFNARDVVLTEAYFLSRNAH